MINTKIYSKNKKTNYQNIQPVVGKIYYLIVKEKRKDLYCDSFSDKKVYLRDINSNYLFVWDIKHFSYMVRNCEYKGSNLSFVENISEEENNKRVENNESILRRQKQTKIQQKIIRNQLYNKDNFSNTNANANLSYNEQNLINLFRQLPEIRQKTVIDTIRFMEEDNSAAQKKPDKRQA